MNKVSLSLLPKQPKKQFDTPYHQTSPSRTNNAQRCVFVDVVIKEEDTKSHQQKRLAKAIPYKKKATKGQA